MKLLRASVVLVLVLVAGAAVGVAPAAALTPTITTLTMQPPAQGNVGQQVGFRVDVTADDDQVPPGVVAILTGGSCGTGTPLETAPLDSDGIVTLTHTFDSPGDLQFNACFFAGSGSGYEDSESGYQDYRIVAAGPVVTAQPTSRTAVAGTQVSFTADASGRPTPTVRWQRSQDGGPWVDIAGATSRTLTRTATAGANGDRFRAVFRNSGGVARTNPATLFVTHAFLGYRSPGTGPHEQGSTPAVVLRLGDAAGRVLGDRAAGNAPVRVQLRSTPTGGVRTETSCGYDAAANVFRCRLRIPGSLSDGRYHLATQTGLGGGPWVLAAPYGGARNPRPLDVG